ncbi:HK97 family phage prohead protease [Micromonosporaceae bacterium B7E4]
MTIHRAYGHVDRAALREGAPLRVVMASEGRQADGIDLRMSGAQLDRFRGNPVLGYGHSYWGRGNLPIGRVMPETIAVDGTLLAGELDFDQGDEFARETERKMRNGYLNAVSIGFEVVEWESENDNYWRGGVATKWELTELSVVPVPMDAKALVTAGRDLAPDDVERLVEAFRAALSRPPVVLPSGPTITPAEPAPNSPPPPAAGVSEDAARTFFAAFDSEESHA